MNNSVQTKITQEVVAAIEILDLDPIKFKLMDKEEGYAWSRTEADSIEIEYKRFLILLAKFPHATIVPSKIVDKFWHAHILDTLKYAEDCQKTFGYFLHHFPYFGMRGEEDAANLVAAATATRELYNLEFGRAEAAATSFCGATNTASFCGATNTAGFCGATNNVSFCGATTSVPQQAAKEEAAFCGATNNASFCGATNTASFCGATNNVSFCGGAHSDQVKLTDNPLNTSLRPILSIS